MLLEKVPQSSSFQADGLESVLVRPRSFLLRRHDCNYANANDSSEAAARARPGGRIIRALKIHLRPLRSLALRKRSRYARTDLVRPLSMVYAYPPVNANTSFIAKAKVYDICLDNTD